MKNSGIKTNKKFLSGLIPKEWEEIVYEYDKYWMCKCKRNDDTNTYNSIEHDIEFDKICKNIIKEFGEHLMEIYSISSGGSDFEVYLRKNNQ
jgi:hypothetical protein